MFMNRTESILKRLINTNTTNPPGNEMNMVREILNFFPEDIDYELIHHGENRASLVISIKGKRTEEIAFVGHIDTVPVTDEGNWLYPPFDGVVADGYMYGRGTSDMKGGVTAMILTALYFIENGITPPYSLKFCFTADEESNGIGISAIMERGLLNNAIKVFIPEPSDEKIGICEKGALWFNLLARGKSSHASKPQLGVNAIEYLIDFVEKLKSTIDLEKEHPYLGKNTCSLTTIRGGVKTNVIPDEARATIDIRTIPGTDHERIIKNAKDILQSMTSSNPSLRMELEVTNNRPPIAIDEDDDFIKEIVGVLKKMSYPVSFKGLYFYTDGSQIIPLKSIPFAIFGPGEENMAHQRNEKVEIESINRMANFYIEFILNS